MTETTIQSLAPRTKAFEVDDSQDDLGQENKDEEDYNRYKILQRDLGELSIIASLIRVQYGKWESEPACLLTTRFQFQKGNAKLFRFKHAGIVLEFNARPKSSASADPKILDYGPRQLESTATKENRTWHYTAILSAKATAGPLEIGPELRASIGGGFVKHHASYVRSNDWGDRYHTQAPNCVKIWLKEDSRQEQGIPLELIVTVIVSCPGPMQATVEVRSDTMFHLLARPWTRDDPVLLDPGAEYGKQLPGSDLDFSSLTTEQWRQLVTPDLQQRNLVHAAV